MKILLILVAIAALSSLGTYTLLQEQLTSNHPVSLDEQLATDELVIAHEMLLKDVMQPAFGDVVLVGVSTTNSCSAFEKGCFGNREMTEEEFATYTGRGPKISLLVYQTTDLITSEELTELQTRLNAGPYTLKNTDGSINSRFQEGVSSLYSLSVMADPGDTQIRVVIRPLS